MASLRNSSDNALGGAARSSAGPSLGASIAVHGALVATLVWTLQSAPVELHGGAESHTASITFERPEPVEPPEPEPTPEEVEPDAADDPSELPPAAFEPLDVTPEPEPPAAAEPATADPRLLEAPAAQPVAWPTTNRVVVRPTGPPAPPEVPSEAPPEPVESEQEPVEEPAEGGATRDAAPLPGSCPPPIYPRMAERRRWSGTVVLAVDVDVEGRVTAVRIHESSGHGVLDEAARDAVLHWRFAPALVGGVPAPVTVRKPIEFKL